jgi:hypothetical protein
LSSSGDLLSFAQAILRIKAFCATSLKAVKTQVWVAISVYGLVAIVKATATRPQSLQNSPNSERDDFRKHSDFRGFLGFDEWLPADDICIQFKLLDL